MKRGTVRNGTCFLVKTILPDLGHRPQAFMYNNIWHQLPHGTTDLEDLGSDFGEIGLASNGAFLQWGGYSPESSIFY